MNDSFVILNIYEYERAGFMIFSELFFIYLFLPVCVLLYYIMKEKYRNIVLIILSLVFYAWGEPVFIWLLMLATCMNYLFGRMISYETDGSSKLGLALGLIMNIGVFVIVKHGGFIAENINSIFGTSIYIPESMILPIGAAFYTLRASSYLIDCYWERIPAEKKFGSFLLYMTMFPIMPYGPVVRYESIRTQFISRSASIVNISEGMGRFIIGLSKKVLLADQLGVIADQFLGGNDIGMQTVLGSWYGVIMFALQVYFTLSGFSDMAIGLGRVFGFKFEENFNYPFMCSDVTDFWHRWHISVSRFFHDYLLYIPIFGKRRKYAGLFITALCMGLWHGASWNFVIWGIFFAVFIAAETALGRKQLRKIPQAVRHIYSKIIIAVSFCMFYFTELSDMGACLKNMFFMGGGGFADALLGASIKNNIFLIAAAVIACFPVSAFIKKRAEEYGDQRICNIIQTTGTVLLCVLFIVSSVFLVNSANDPQLYFNI